MHAVQLLCTVCAAAAETNAVYERAGNGAFALDRRIGHGHTDKSVRACTLHTRVRVCVMACSQSVRARRQHATCMWHGTCHVGYATDDEPHPNSSNATSGQK